MENEYEVCVCLGMCVWHVSRQWFLMSKAPMRYVYMVYDLPSIVPTNH